jgi:hypothetical protein
MRRPFAFAFVLVASCAAPPDSSESAPPEPAPAVSALAVEPAPPVSEPEREPLESRVEDGELNFTPSESIGEAQEPLAWIAVLTVTCMLAGAIATEYGCKKHVLEKLCPPGTVITRTVRDPWIRTKTAQVNIPCDVLESMVCGTAGVSGAEVFRQMCAGIL